MHRKLLLLSILAFCFLSSRAAYVPVPLTYYNYDVIANGVGAALLSTTVDVDATGSGYVFIAADFQQTGAAALPLATRSLPVSGLITSAATTGMTFQLANYTGNNAIQLSATHATDSLGFVTPQAFGELTILTTSGNGAATMNVTVNFTDGSTQAGASAFSILDWYQAAPPANTAITYIGRASRSTGALDGQGSGSPIGPNLYEIKFTINAINYAKTIRSVTFNRVSTSSGAPHILAITGATICSGAVTAGTTASSAGASACPAVNFNLSLPTATAGVGITYQWQSSTTGGAPWTTIAAATSASYTTNQTVATTYRAYVACNGGTADTSTPVTVTMKPANQCYCIPVASSATYYINNFSTTGGTTNVTNSNSGPGITSQGYSDFSGTQTVTALPGTIINFSGSHGSSTSYTFGTKIYVDWNQNGLFTDAGETMFATTGYGSTFTGSFTIPLTATSGNTRMRVISDYYTSTGPAPCAFSTTGPYGEGEDYTFNVTPLPLCVGSPSTGTISSTVGNACIGVSFNLSTTGATTGSGIVYQWQLSTTGSAPWSDISGANSPVFSTTQTVATSYRLKVTCSLVDSSFSNVVAVGQNLPSACYCIPVATSNTYYINNFTTTGAMTNVANPSTAGTTSIGYSNFTNLSIVGLVGSTINFTSTFTGGTFGARIYVDWNQNGNFTDAGEQMFTTTGYVSSISGSFVIPSTATPGNTRLRLINDFNLSTGPAPCGPFAAGQGEAEDYTFTVIPNVPCAAPTAQATALVLTPAIVNVTVAFTASSPAADKYIVLRTPGTTTPTVTPVNATAYTIGATLGNATVVSSGTNATSISDATAAPSTQYRYTIYSYNDICVGGPLYNVTTPLSGTTTTNGASVYTWNGSISTDWQIAGNWTPSRTVLDPTDVLQFNNGIVDSVINIPTQTIGRLVFTNNTIATFKAQTAATRTLTFSSDNNAATNELDIAAGSSLISNGTANILTLKYAGAGATGKIAGNLEISNLGTIANTIDFSNAIDTVTATGSLIAGGTLGTSVFTSTAANLAVMGTYNHKYTTVGGGNVPTATWGPASTVLISGYTTSTGGPAGGLGQTFNNFTYNAPLQTANSQWSGTLPTTVNGTLSVVSTGTGQWLMATTTAYNVTANNYIQTGGIVDLGTSTGSKTLNVSGVFNQSAGILKATGAGVVTFNYNGTVATQNVSFLDSAVAGSIVYRVTNPNGINLTGTGLLATGTPAFKINTGGGVQITSSAANPINTTFVLTYFATGTTLTYDGTANQAITAAIWPTTNGPLNFTTNNTGTGPTNVVTLPAARTVAGTLTITNGVLSLGNNNLTVSNNATGAISISTPSATKMIAADGTGQLIRAMGTTANTTYLFPVGDVTATPEYSPASLSMSSTGARLMGVRVVNAHNPNDASANYLNRYWVITDTATSAYTYNGNFTYTTADIIGTEANLRLSAWNGTAWNQVPSLPNTGVLTIQGSQSSAFLPLGGTQVTGRTAAANNIYTWNGAVSTDYQVAGNWTPARNVPDPGDFLQFNNAIVDTVKNIPTQIITRLTFTNNTTGIFQTGATNTLTIQSDNVTTTDELSIAAGSNLTSNGTSALTLAFAGTGATVNIAGTMESVSNAVNNVFNFTNATATVTAVGTLAEGGSNSNSAVTGTTITNLLVNGLFNYKYTTNTVGLPIASWNTGSTLLISGYTTVTGGPNGGQNQAFYNLTYNCPNQTAAANWSGTGATTVINNLTVASTGTGSWAYSNGTGYTANIGNFIQTGGTFNTNSAAATAPCTFNITGNFNQTGGTFTCVGASTGANAPVLNFSGTAVQNVNFNNAAPVGSFNYRISNPAGINLTGSGTLTTAFNINANGGVRISSAAVNPINTTLALTYATTATTLTYDPATSATATASVWPVAAGPLNVTINTGGSANVITVPFSRTIAGTLTMTSGDMDITSNDLTLGTAPASVGTLTYGAGNIRVTTGKFIRYYNTSGLPTTIGTGAGFYPIASSTGANRNVALYFSSATAFNTTGGTIGVGHTDATGLATVSVIDPLPTPYTITSRTNAAWNFTATGVAGTGTIGAKITGQGLFSSTTPANLRMMQPAAVVGTYVAGSGVSAQRTGLVVADLASPYHIGANALDIGGAYIATTTGNWSTAGTWLGGLIPGVANEAYINPGVVVTADAATNTARALTLYPGATLNINAATSTVTVDSAMQNNGTVNVGGGTLIVNGSTTANGIANNAGAVFNVSSGTTRLGPVNGSNKPFTNNGTLTVSGGTLGINGNLQLNAASIFTQSGGAINVDGNAGGVVANSVLTGTPIVNILTPNVTLSAGTMTVVDPHVGATTNTFVYNAAANINASGTHTFRTGDGTSLDTGYNAAYGFSVNTNVGTGKLAFMNVIANAGTAANSWLVLGAGSTGILGNFTVNTGGEYRQNGTGSTVYIAGNLVNNGTYSALGLTYFGNYINGTASSALAAQSVTGTGTFRNLLTAPTGKFYKIQVNNNYNVTFNIGDIPFSSTVVMTASAAPAPVGPSRMIMAANSILSELGGASSTTSATAGWIVGRYQKAAAVGGFNGTFPVGDLNYYTPINIPTATVTTAGAIWGSTTTNDQPQIATSSILAAKSVNRYYTLTPVNGIVFSPGATATFNWNALDVDAGATTATFAVGKYAGTTWTYPTTATPTATSIQGTGLDLNVAGDFQVGEPCSALNITTPPTNQVACLGAPATFSVGLAATSYVLYQWQKGTTNIVGATGPTYTIPATVAGDAGSYRVVLSSVCPAVTVVNSVAATLTVNVPASITTPPATQAICEGSPATFSVTAAGTGVTYQWQKNGVNIPAAVSASYTIPVVAPADAANYSVVVTGTAPCGFVTSVPAALTVKPLPLTITPATSTTFCPGGTVSICGSTTPGTLTYQWQQNGSPLTGQTNTCYTATTTGNYTAVITNTANGCSNTSNIVAVSVTGAPQSTITPAGAASFCQGSTITLHGLSTPGLTFEWYLNGNTTTPVSTDSVYTTNVVGTYTAKVSIGTGCSTTSTPTVVTMNALPVVTTTPTGNQAICSGDTLTITGFYTNATPVWKLNGTPVSPVVTGNIYKATAGGNYTVTVTSTTTGCANTSAPVTLTVNTLPTVTVTSSGATSFCEGLTDTLKASPATGLTYLWYKNGVVIAPAATGANYVATQTGNYTVVATNGNGCNKTSAITAITVNPLPNVVVTPSLGLNICQGQTTNLCVPTAAGINYQWKSGTTNIVGATAACYAATATGNYSVVATNPTTTCSATSVVSAVVVSPVPTATATAAGSTTICTGDTVILNANTGTGLSYQWRLNGNNIAVGGTLSSYGAGTTGTYSVVVTNGNNCSSTSTGILVTVNPRPTASISYTTPIIFCEGGAVVLTAVSNTGTSYQWQNNGLPITGSTSNSVIFSQSGNYSVVITNALGCSTVSPTILVVVNPLPLPVITNPGGGLLTTGSFASYQWYFNSHPITGANGQTISTGQNGGYVVAVTDANGCTNYSSVFFVNNVGVGGPSITAATIKVFPNPVRNIVTIDAPAMVNVIVRDLTGRIVLKQDDAKKLDMSQLADGAYMLMISDKNGTMVKTERLLKVSE